MRALTERFIKEMKFRENLPYEFINGIDDAVWFVEIHILEMPLSQLTTLLQKKRDERVECINLHKGNRDYHLGFIAFLNKLIRGSC